jgi:uncharacterized membrane protein YccC
MTSPFKTPVFIYMLKCMTGLFICYLLYKNFPRHQFFWSMISVLLVFTLDDTDGNKLAYDRMKANVLGSLIGLLLFLIYPPNIFTISIGILITILIGTGINLGNATRSALASVLIVMIHEQQEGSWKIAVERVFCVVAGCVAGLIVTFVFSLLSGRINKPEK